MFWSSEILTHPQYDTIAEKDGITYYRNWR